MYLKLFIIYISAHYPQPILIEATVHDYETWGTEIGCVQTADSIITDTLELEPPARQDVLADEDFSNDDPTATYFYTCTLEAQL